MKTIKLSSKFKKDATGEFTYFLSAITKKQKEQILDIRKEYKQDILDGNLKEYMAELNELSFVWGIDCKGVLKIGETSNIQTGALSEFVEVFKGRDTEGFGRVGYNRELHFRDYSKSLNKQKEISWLVNVYQDSRACVASAVRQMNQEFCCLWESKESKFINQFTDDICSIELK